MRDVTKASEYSKETSEHSEQNSEHSKKLLNNKKM